MSVLALDIGSSSTRAAMFDENGRSRLFVRSYAIRYGHDGTAELNPRTLRTAVRGALKVFKSRPTGVIASCAFWHGLLGLDANRRPLTPIYTWADSRCMTDAARLRKEFSEDEILQRTGCMLRFAFWPAKLRWLRRTNRALFSRVRLWVSPSDWLGFDRFGELATSPSMASATGLFNLTSRRWEPEICAALGIKESQLPPIRSSLHDDGKVLTAIGDGAASNIGCGATTENVAAINLGTSAAVRVLTRRAIHIPNGLFRFFAGEQTFVVGGAISNAGNLRNWCERELGIPRGASLHRSHAAADTLIALPFLVAERAPDWPEIPAVISGLNTATRPIQIFRALMTSAFYRLADIFDRLERSTGRIERIIVSGGMTKSKSALAVLADALGRDLEVATDPEASLRGAAIHAVARQHRALPVREKHGIVRFDHHYAELHRIRRKKQRSFYERLSSPRD